MASNTTYNLFSEELQQQEKTKFKRKRLTPRQYDLHKLLLEHSMNSKDKLSHKQILEYMDEEYDYSLELKDHPNRPLNNTHARRQLSDDLDAITTFEDFHKVYVGGRYATSQLEINIHLLKEEIRLKKELRKLHMKRRKAGLDGQMVMQFTGYEKEEWESYIRKEEEKLNDMEQTYDQMPAHIHRA